MAKELKIYDEFADIPKPPEVETLSSVEGDLKNKEEETENVKEEKGVINKEEETENAMEEKGLINKEEAENSENGKHRININ